MKTALTIGLAVLFCSAGVAVGCVDLRDHWTVDPTDVPGTDPAVQPASEPLTINQAKREVQVIRDDTNRWIEWRNADIAKEESKVAFIEGFASAGGEALLGEVGKIAGPFAAPLFLLGGYFIKRKGDSTPDQTRQEKEDSYNAGIEFGKSLALAAVGKQDDTPEATDG